MTFRWCLRRAVLFAATLFSGVASADAQRPELTLHCTTQRSGSTLTCLVQLRRNNQPLAGADLILGAHMPSMPMAHSVKPVAATPSSTPGEYRAVLELEMAGVWAIQIDVTAPLRERQVRRLRVEPCRVQSPCTAAMLR